LVVAEAPDAETLAHVAIQEGHQRLRHGRVHKVTKTGANVKSEIPMRGLMPRRPLSRESLMLFPRPPIECRGRPRGAYVSRSGIAIRHLMPSPERLCDLIRGHR
jgi:hypothetical protein